jgi:hypothetical protein
MKFYVTERIGRSKQTPEGLLSCQDVPIAHVESYSIKKREPLYSFARSVPLEDVAAVLARTQARLEMANYAGIPEEDIQRQITHRKAERTAGERKTPRMVFRDCQLSGSNSSHRCMISRIFSVAFKP